MFIKKCFSIIFLNTSFGAEAMKLFQVVCKCLAIIGIRQLRSNEENRFNARNFGILLYFGLFAISTTTFIVRYASTFLEYADAFFAWITGSLVFIGYFVTILKSTKLFQLIENLEETIENRK